MKKQITAALVALLASTSVFAKDFKPIFLGDVTQKDELLIVKNKTYGQYNCSARSVLLPPQGQQIDPGSLLHAEWTTALADDDGFNIDGVIDGEIFSLSLKYKTGFTYISMQEDVIGKPGQESSHSVNSSGDLNTAKGSFHLTFKVNGKYYTAGCSKHKAK